MSTPAPWVIKLGSALVTTRGLGLDPKFIRDKAAELAALQSSGIRPVLVSSGSVAEGIARLQWQHRPRAVHELQAAAAIGQTGLVQAYETALQEFGIRTAQVLLTHEDIADRQRYLNARSTLHCLLQLGVIPVINENDTVSTAEIRLGDNDTLAGLVANLLEAKLLVLLTDQPGLLDRNPARASGGRLIPEGKAGDPKLDACAGGSAQLGRGGMRTKLQAAAIAARSGTDTVIADGRDAQVLGRLARGEACGTLLRAANRGLAARKRWLAGLSRTQGRVRLDGGAVRALQEQGGSLLAAGVVAVEGEFSRGAVIALCTAEDVVFAQGLSNYGANEIKRLQGCASRDISARLGHCYEPELVHRDNLILLADTQP